MTRHAIKSAWLMSFLLSVPGLAAGPSGVDEGWWQRVRDDIEFADYRITRTDGQSCQAVNRAQRLIASFRDDGVVVRPEGAGPGGWEWGVSLDCYGSEAALSIAENRVEIVRGPLTEWYVNSPDGLAHRFTISSPPPDRHRGKLVLDLKVTGTLRPSFVSGGEAVDFFGAGSVSVLRHGGLEATDAMGRNATARFTAIPGGVRIVVDDAGAVYPITIHSVATSAGWTVSGDENGARLGQCVAPAGDENSDQFGWFVAAAGDVNGDGYADVIVGAHMHDVGGGANANRGRAYVYLGETSGLATSPAWTGSGDENNADQDVAVVHMFKFEGDKVVELWDLGQLLSKNSPNENGAF